MNLPVLLSVTIIAALYSSVGHGGATGYLAILSLINVPPNAMSSTALILNCLTAGISLMSYARAGYLSLRLSTPFLIASIPCAFLGSRLRLSEHEYAWLLGGVLILVAIRLAFLNLAKSGEAEEAKFVHPPSLIPALSCGAVLGFLSGAVGIGGGVFLSPVIILFRWADTKSTSACAALFIIANSLSGILGRITSGRLICDDLFPYLVFGFAGAVIGSYWGTRISTGRSLRRVLAVVLLIAAAKMFVK